MVAPPSVKLAEGKLNGVFGPAMITVPDTVVFSAPFTSTCATCEATVPSAMLTIDPVAATAVPPSPTTSAITASTIAGDGAFSQVFLLMSLPPLSIRRNRVLTQELSSSPGRMVRRAHNAQTMPHTALSSPTLDGHLI